LDISFYSGLPFARFVGIKRENIFTEREKDFTYKKIRIFSMPKKCSEFLIQLLFIYKLFISIE